MASLESKSYLKNVFVGKSHFLSTRPNSEGDFVPVLYAINTKVGVVLLDLYDLFIPVIFTT